ncbi:MAG: M48 family metallopeptidase [Erysipelotrichaceae bacterium]|nr:M48 family metallopeptidase [Erysipelotrichaceae bacterium]
MIEIKGIHFDVEIEHKNIRHMYMRLKGNRICVSAPLLMPKYLVYQFIEGKRDWIYNTYNRLQTRKEASHLYDGGDLFYVYGEPYELFYQEGSRNSVRIKEKQIFLYGPDKEKAIKYLYKHFDADLLKKAWEYFYKYQRSILIGYGYLKTPELRARAMTSKWGVCYTTKDRICISSYLIHFPLECLEYIMVHEMTHLIIPNHSKRFYQIVSNNLPDYKQIRKKLKG